MYIYIIRDHECLDFETMVVDKDYLRRPKAGHGVDEGESKTKNDRHRETVCAMIDSYLEHARRRGFTSLA